MAREGKIVLETAVLVVLLLAVAALAFYCVAHGPWAMELDERELVISALPPSLEGLRILFIGDLHIRRWDYRILWVYDAIRRAEYDIVLSTGDMVEHSGRSCLPDFLPVLTASRGAFMVPGNNENLEEDREALFETFTRHGVQVLRNEHVSAGEDLVIVGVDDPSRDGDDLQAALQGLSTETFAILLAHTPEVFPEAQAAKIPLTLAGHTHGGQVRLPLVGAIWTDTPRTDGRYDCGHFSEGASQLFVTRGVGMSKLPLRCLCNPEIHLLTLRSGSAQQEPVPS